MSKLKIYCKDPKCKPQRQHPTDAGLDLRADSFRELHTNTVAKIKTGIHVEIPENHVGLIFPRSSLGLRGITLANTVGVIDSDYRGEIICAMVSRKLESIHQYERIAQLVIVPISIPLVTFVEELEDLSNTKRGEGGFGHTGKH